MRWAAVGTMSAIPCCACRSELRLLTAPTAKEDAMGTIKVSIDAEAAGKQSKFNFAWEGDDEEINEVIGFVAERADEAGISPEALGQSTCFTYQGPASTMIPALAGHR